MELEPIEPTNEPEQPKAPTPKERKRVRIGDLLVENNLITEAQLMLALQEQKISGKKIGRVLVDLGMISETKLLEMLGSYLNIPFLEMKFFQLDHSVSLTLDESHARRYRVLILSEKDDGYLLGMADASDLIAQDVFDVLTLEGSVKARNHIGGTAPEQVKQAAIRAHSRVLR